MRVNALALALALALAIALALAMSGCRVFQVKVTCRLKYVCQYVNGLGGFELAAVRRRCGAGDAESDLPH